MTKGYSELGGGMRARWGGARGPWRFLAVSGVLVLLVFAFNHWRLVTVNADLSERLQTVETLLKAATERGAVADAARRSADEGVQRITEQLVRARADLSDTAEKLRTAQTELSTAHQRITELQQRNDELQHHNAEAQQSGADNGDVESPDSRVKTLQTQLSDARAELTQLRQTTAVNGSCPAAAASAGDSATCEHRLKTVEFDLNTCRFAQRHAGNSGIHQQQAGGQMMVGKDSVSRLFERSRAASQHTVQTQQDPTQIKLSKPKITKKDYDIYKRQEYGMDDYKQMDEEAIDKAAEEGNDKMKILPSNKRSTRRPNVGPFGDYIGDESGALKPAPGALGKLFEEQVRQFKAGRNGFSIPDGEETDKQLGDQPPVVAAMAEPDPGDDADAEGKPAAAALVENIPLSGPGEEVVETVEGEQREPGYDAAVVGEDGAKAAAHDGKDLGDAHAGEDQETQGDEPDAKETALISGLEELAAVAPKSDKEAPRSGVVEPPETDNERVAVDDENKGVAAFARRLEKLNGVGAAKTA